ncbi:MAG: DUF6056 family protein [Lachnospiraceae bacterium]|nr:DUF6056 family protein [Lachnospiraceae bacterium]
MVFNSLFLFSTMILFMFISLRKINNSYLYLKLLIVSLILFILFGYTAYTEIFFWFSGATSFSLPLSFMFLALSGCILMDDNKIDLFFIPSVLFGALAAGGALMVPGLCCYAGLMIILFSYLPEKKIPRAKLAVFALWVSFALINTIAPGNYSRSTVYADSFDIALTLSNCITVVANRYRYLFSNPMIIPTLMILLLCGLSFSKELKIDSKKISFFLLSLLGLFSPFIATFPVVLGYASAEITNRCEFIVDVSIVFSLSVCFLFLGYLLSSLSEKVSMKICAIIAISAVVLFFLFIPNISKMKVLTVSEQVLNGKYATHYATFCALMDKLETHEKDSDIIIPDSEFPEDIDCFFPFYIAGSPDYWVNEHIADYFDYNSIAAETD